MANKTNKMRFYRVIKGVRTPYTFVIDQHSTILREEVDKEFLQQINSSASLRANFIVDEEEAAKSPPVSVREAELRARGLSVTTKDDGTVVLSGDITDKEANMASFFALVGDNPFPGTDDIRVSYAREVESIGGANCTACDKAELIRKHRLLIEERLGNV